MMPAPLQSHPCLGGIFTKYAAFHFFKSQQEETTGICDDKVHSFISNYMKFFQPLYVNMQFKLCFCPFFYTF